MFNARGHAIPDIVLFGVVDSYTWLAVTEL